jgi:hypothetical protein
VDILNEHLEAVVEHLLVDHLRIIG